MEMGFTVVIRIVASFVSGAKWERMINSFASVLVVVIGKFISFYINCNASSYVYSGVEITLNECFQK